MGYVHTVTDSLCFISKTILHAIYCELILVKMVCSFYWISFRLFSLSWLLTLYVTVLPQKLIQFGVNIAYFGV